MTEHLIPGLVVVDALGANDQRGSMHRFFDSEILAGLSIEFVPRQVAMAYNRERGTLRGLHFQMKPEGDAKIVSCQRGRLYDVIVDLRTELETYRTWQAIELRGDHPQCIVVPSGCAHGYLTLEPDTEVLYVIDASYRPELQSGVRWDDPALAIDWPFPPTTLSEKDRHFCSLD